VARAIPVLALSVACLVLAGPAARASQSREGYFSRTPGYQQQYVQPPDQSGVAPGFGVTVYPFFSPPPPPPPVFYYRYPPYGY